MGLAVLRGRLTARLACLAVLQLAWPSSRPPAREEGAACNLRAEGPAISRLLTSSFREKTRAPSAGTCCCSACSCAVTRLMVMPAELHAM